NLLSPVYSPPVAEWFPWIKNLMPVWFSPALLILWAPGGFRGTCYYYRKAYYRSAFLTPPACGVQGIPFKNYLGERGIFVIQNIHRYFMYLAVVFILVFLPMDVLHALFFQKPGGGAEFGLSVGTLVLLLNNTLLGLYTLGCHSFRHLVGGKLDSFSIRTDQKLRYFLWKYVSKLNEHHMLWAWCSLAGVCFADLYVRLCASGIWNNARLF